MSKGTECIECGEPATKKCLRCQRGLCSCTISNWCQDCRWEREKEKRCEHLDDETILGLRDEEA